MAVILGINAFHAGASAALLVDGVPVAAVAEERLNRVKYYGGFPALAIRRCLEMAGLAIHDVDAVAVGREPAANRARKLEYALRNPGLLLNLLKIRTARERLDDTRTLIAAELGEAPETLRFAEHRVEHHLAHISSAYHASGWDSAAGISIDGSGDFVTCMMAECRGADIRPLHRIYVPHSLGSVYTMVSQFIGYDRYGDEGKVMGLAPLGENTYADAFDDMVTLTADGFTLNPRYFLPFGSNQGVSITDGGEMLIHRHFSDHVVRLWGAPRPPGGELGKREMDLAFGVQHLFEKVYLHLLDLLHQRVPLPRVAMAGGCALNSVANGKLLLHTPFRETFIQPAAGDEGLALGAALYVSRCVLGEKPAFAMRDAYLGPGYSAAEIERELAGRGVRFTRHDPPALLEATVDDLEQGKVVGWYQGRSEWGPRALGNRSILTHPGFPGMKEVLNARIKRREWFRPFAPAVLAERQDEIFEHPHPSPFMLHVHAIRPEWRERLSAVNHVDNTGRLQSVARDENPLYHGLISAFERRTGVPVLLNTSFNENEPIVDSPGEAIDCFLRTRMDTLVMGPFIARKNGDGG